MSAMQKQEIIDAFGSIDAVNKAIERALRLGNNFVVLNEGVGEDGLANYLPIHINRIREAIRGESV